MFPAGWGLLVAATVMAQEPTADAELSRHLTWMRSQVQDVALPVARREELVLEMCRTLDRAAQSSASALLRERRWSEAVELLDWFVKQNPGSPGERSFRFQCGVYRWAQGRSWREVWQQAPADPKAREQAIAALDDAIARFRSASSQENKPTLAENVRFRLAEALADRAELEPRESPKSRECQSEAIRLLDPPPSEPSLSGFWHLLCADLLRLSRRTGEAERELDAAAKSTPPPPEQEMLDVRVALLLDEGRYAAAIKAIESSHLGGPAKGLWMVRARIAERAASPPGLDRYWIESDLFRWIRELRGGKSAESRLALAELARAGIAPHEKHPPEVWDALADAYATAGDPARAGAAMVHAAERSAALLKAADAAGYRMRGGAYFFQAGQFQEADKLLSQVVDDPAAGAFRPRAGMLCALARGRALALHMPGASIEAYKAALERQLRDFPGEPSTDEARWLRGKLALASGDRQQAEALWLAIAPAASRWLESRLAICALDRDELERRQLNPERQVLQQLLQKTDHFLSASLRQARSDTDTAELSLARARLQLTPRLGSAETAREECERVTRLAVETSLHYRARLYRLVALVELGHYVEAEREAQDHASWRVAIESAALFDTVGLLDRCAATAPTDLAQRRFGLVLRLIVEPMLGAEEKFSPQERSELGMRLTRSLLFVGADREARHSLPSWRGLPQANSDSMLRDLGDTYSRLEMYSLDIDVERLRMKNNATGSPAWFDARYALAVAYFRTGQLQQAARLIDATTILHPDLGGGELREKFIHLRQRLGVKP